VSAAPDTATVIEARDLTKVYAGNGADTAALRGVSLTVKPGEFAAVMGPSGSGKSTLMHILGCLDTPTEGTYVLSGRNVADLDEYELAELRRTTVGFVFQAFNLLPRSTVMRNVVMPMLYTRTPRDEREVVDAPLQRTLRRANAARRNRPLARQRSVAHPRRRTDRESGYRHRRLGDGTLRQA
jgi:ABC-type lipoprotein export system ATPase subunit